DAALDAIIEQLAKGSAPRSGRQLEDDLQDSEHARDTVRAALRLGVERRRLVVTEGPKRARLYAVATGELTPVRECPAVRDKCAPRSAIECAGAYRNTRTRALTESADFHPAAAAHSKPAPLTFPTPVDPPTSQEPPDGVIEY